MKKTVLAFTRRTIVNGKVVEPGRPIAELATDLPWDTLIASLHRGELAEHEVKQSEDELSQPPESAVVESTPADAEPVKEEQAESTQDAATPAVSEPSASDTPLEKTTLTDSLVEALGKEGITTLEQIGEYMSNGGDLADLESVGPRQAKRIAAWWQQNSQGE